jgi:predicted phage terminase large subunit-like protein
MIDENVSFLPIEEIRARLLGSFILFTKFFYKLRTGREFQVYEGESRESHIITISKAFTSIFNGEDDRVIINIPPRYGKTECAIHFIAWSLARYPDSNFMYVSYSHTLASWQTNTIRHIIQLPQYREIFGVELSKDTSAKDNFTTTSGGSVYGVGAGGTITGRGAGIFGCDRFGGCIVVDDIHKPDEVTSDLIRESINNWWKNTLLSRLNYPEKTPICFIGQRLHESDLPANLIKGFDGSNWKKIILPALDGAGNALCPAIHTKEKLLKMKEFMKYDFSAQYMQDPLPAGGGLFSPNDFILVDIPPEILSTFITIDTAETDRTQGDASVFSLWGIHRIKHFGIDTEMYGLYWMDCLECWVEPKDLVTTFMQFYRESSMHPIKPSLAAIEKKSTGTMLISILKDIQGLRIMDIERTKKSGSKTDRFLKMQPYIAQKMISIPRNGKHTTKCLEHMGKITANNSHRYDDIADTVSDAIQLALIDKILYIPHTDQKRSDVVLDQMASLMQKYLPTGGQRWQI